MIESTWTHPVTVTPNNFVYKSLSNWACNIAVGCNHGCTFCYVPSASTVKLGAQLAPFGVNDPDAEWGEYVLLRPLDKPKFLASVKRAEKETNLKPDGNRAVMFCSTTDAYQMLRDKTLAEARKENVRWILRCILENSTLNVRILTRSPLAKLDFDLMKEFGKRLMFGMSIPTLNNQLAAIYEPTAPAPTQRLATLTAAAKAGLNIYVAMAPTYPDILPYELSMALDAFREVGALTIFHEPINIRAENVARIAAHAKSIGMSIDTTPFASRESWITYALKQLGDVERTACGMGLTNLHLWPDKSLKGHTSQTWLDSWWNRISEWPK